VWHFLFGLRGRISRASFCLYAALAFIVLLTLLSSLYAYSLATTNFENGGPLPWPSSTLGMIGVGLWFLILFLLFVSSLTVTLKRLHDRDKASWWLLVFVVAPNVLSSAARLWYGAHAGWSEALGYLLDAAAVGLFAWAFVELACLRGTAGDNRFGAEPLPNAR
jgi:uncharacterized membrane protein YhaH (DUF805 family)